MRYGIWPYFERSGYFVAIIEIIGKIQIIIEFSTHHRPIRLDFPNTTSHRALPAHPPLRFRRIHVQRHDPRGPIARQPATRRYADSDSAIGILSARDLAAGVGVELSAGGLAAERKVANPRRALHVQLVAGVRVFSDEINLRGDMQ